MSIQASNPQMRILSPADLKFGPGCSTAVISSAQKFIIPVPALGAQGEPLVYPQDHPQAGQPIVDYKGRPIGECGMVFFNAKDQAWQAVAGDGEGVIIINEVTEAQAELLDQKIREFQADPTQLTLAELKQVLAYAREQLGLQDMYNSNRTYVKEKMTPVHAGLGEQAAYGFKKRDDRDIYQAVYVRGHFIFQGPSATAQVFEHGGVIIEQQGKTRGIQPEVFVRTYRRADGRPLNSLSRDIEVQ